MVIDERHADRHRLVAQRVQHVGECLVVVRRDRTILRLLVDHLKHLAACVAHELRVFEVEVELRLAVGRLVVQVAAREDGEADPGLSSTARAVRPDSCPTCRTRSRAAESP